MEKRELKDEYDAIIIGAGIGGLTCGALLAKNGLKTLVLEQNYKPGGYVTSYRRKGFIFDVPHVLSGCAKDAPIERIISYLGLDIKFIESEPFQKFIYPDHTIRQYSNIERYEEELTQHFPAERKNIDRFFATLTKLWDEIMRAPYQPSRLQLMSFPLRFPGLVKYSKRTFQQMLDEHFTDSKLKVILATPWSYRGLPSSRVSALSMAAMLMSFHSGGAWYPRGGYQVMADEFAKGLERYGGTLALRSLVTRVLMERGRAVGVELEGGRRIKAKYIISNADTKLTFLKLVGEEHLPSRLAKRLKKQEMSKSGFVVHLGVEMDLTGLDLKYGMVFYIPSYEAMEEDFRVAERGEIITDVEDIRFSMSVTTLKDPDSGLALDGQHCLDIIHYPVPYDYQGTWRTIPGEKPSEEYRELKERVADNFIKAAEKLIPDPSQHILVKEIATPLTYERYTLSSGGAWYDQAPIPERALPAQTEVPGLYMTGAKAHPGGGMFGAIVSGSLTADTILEGALTQGKFALSI